MSLITRTEKGSKLTIQEMDGNLTYLESLAQSDGLEYITEDTTSGNENLEISVTDGTNSSEIKVEPTAISSQVFQDAQNRVSLELGVSTSLFGLRNGDLISGLELDPSENAAGTRLFVEDITIINKRSQIYMSPEDITISSIVLFLPTIPTYADNAAAITGGATANQVYKTSTGELRIVV